MKIISYTLKIEQDRDFRAIRWINPEGKQIFAVLFSFRRKWNPRNPKKGKLAFVLKFLRGSGSGTKGGRTLSIGWRSDSRDWRRTHRGERVGILLSPLEISRLANGPYISR